MNKVLLVGRLTKDCEVRKTTNGKSQCKFVVACDREQKEEEGKQNADFIVCVVYGTSADFMGQWCKKGDLVSVVGRWQTGSYVKDGTTVYTNECFVEKIKLEQSQQKKKQDVIIENNVADEDVDFSEMPF